MKKWLSLNYFYHLANTLCVCRQASRVPPKPSPSPPLLPPSSLLPPPQPNPGSRNVYRNRWKMPDAPTALLVLTMGISIHFRRHNQTTIYKRRIKKREISRRLRERSFASTSPRKSYQASRIVRQPGKSPAKEKQVTMPLPMLCSSHIHSTPNANTQNVYGLKTIFIISICPNVSYTRT